MKLTVAWALALLLGAAGARAQEPVTKPAEVPHERSHPIESVDSDTLAADAGVAPGDRAPDFRLEASTGTRLGRDELAGHWALLVFCPGRDAFERLGAAGDTLRALDARVVGICHDRVALLAAYAAHDSLSYPLLSDPGARVSKLFGMIDPDTRGIERGVVVLDPKGVVRAVLQGRVHAAGLPGVLRRTTRAR